MYGAQNKQMQLNHKIEEAFPTNSWSFTGEFNGNKWQFMILHDKNNEPTDEEKEKLKQLAASVEPNAVLYILPFED